MSFKSDKFRPPPPLLTYSNPWEILCRIEIPIRNSSLTDPTQPLEIRLNSQNYNRERGGGGGGITAWFPLAKLFYLDP